MAKIVRIFVTLLAMMLIMPIYPTISKPIARGDLIDGRDFLSLFIGQSQSGSNDRGYKIIEPKSTSEIEDNQNESIISMETLYSKEDELLEEDSANFGLRTEQRSRNEKFIPKLQQALSSSTDSDIIEKSTTPFADITKRGLAGRHQKYSQDTDLDTAQKQQQRQIIKMVTSGSKIIFLEELTSTQNINNQTMSNSLSNEMQSKEIEDQTKLNTTSSDNDIQVISVRVSSSIGKLRNSGNEKPETTTIIEFNSDDIIKSGDKLLFNEGNTNKNDFINHAHKSEFSIEETEPVTQEAVSDSVNGESTNIHTIVAPPSTINQSPQHHGTAGTRMQRKQDKLVPFQTVIYHDENYHKDGSTHPRSVSYSSIAQTIDELKTWRDIDGLLEAKQNVSMALKSPPSFSEPAKVYGEPEKNYGEPAKVYSEPAKVYGQPSKFYSEPSKIYSEPAKVYGQPEKQYGEPSKVYSEPSKIYSEPSKVYSQPSKMYGEPSKVYWPRQPSVQTTTPRLEIGRSPVTTATTTTTTTKTTTTTTTTRQPNSRKIIFNLDRLPYDLLNAPEPSKTLLEPDTIELKKLHPNTSNNNNPMTVEISHIKKSEKPNNIFNINGMRPHQQHRHHHHHETIMSMDNGEQQHYNKGLVTENPNYASVIAITEDSQNLYTPTPEQNYEIEESVSVMTNGRAHGVQPATVPTISPDDTDDSKTGYVVEGRNYRKYRVEEKTPDGFIVGEYGVVSHNDGSLRGVRYTADSNINPSLIHQALMKFLSL